MANLINAKTSGAGGLETTADNTGNINIQSGGSTVMEVTSAGVAVTGSLTQNGGAYSTQPTFRNLIINGNMAIDQRNAGSSTTASGYTVDRWRTDEVTDGTLTAQQVTDAPSGFSHSYKLTVGTADTNITSNQYSFTMQKIEANNLSHLNYGTANAKTITLSFWVKSSITGNYSLVLKNSAQDFSYIHEYTINVANTWEKKTVTVTGPTSGTWITTGNSSGLFVLFTHAVGSTYATSTLDSWHSSSNVLGSTTSTNLFQTSGATWQITGVQLEVGTTATDFENLQYTTQLQLCQRYYHRLTGNTVDQKLIGAGGYYSATGYRAYHIFPTTMRVEPTISYSNISDLGVLGINVGTVSTLITFDQSNHNIGLACTTSTSTSGSFAFLRLELSANSYFDFSAEL